MERVRNTPVLVNQPLWIQIYEIAAKNNAILISIENTFTSIPTKEDSPEFLCIKMAHEKIALSGECNSECSTAKRHHNQKDQQQRSSRMALHCVAHRLHTLLCWKFNLVLWLASYSQVGREDCMSVHIGNGQDSSWT